MKRAIVTALMFVVPSVWGADADGRYMVMHESCGSYIKDRQARNQTGIAISRAWIEGYVSSYNIHTPATFNILGRTDIESVMLWLDNWCTNNPLKKLGNAMEVLMLELYPDRYRTGKDAGR